MKKELLTLSRTALVCLLSLFNIVIASAQVERTINVPYTASSSPTFQALLYLPSDYSSTSMNYPLLVFCHNSSEAADGASAGTGLAKIYNQASYGGPAYFIEHGGWPATFTNPVNGRQEQFIVVSPQSNTWAINGDELAYIVNFLVANYRVDTSRIHLTGVSSGGAGVVEYAAQMNPDEDPPSQSARVRRWKPADMVAMSEATNNPTQAWGNVIVADSIPDWGFGDENNDLYGEFTLNLTTVINHAKSGYARFTSFNTGHGPWNPFYNPAYTENFTWRNRQSNYSMYSWMLGNSRISVPTGPVANAGPAQTITLPTNQVTLNGNASTGNITSYAWMQVSGPSTATITAPNSVSTLVTGLVQGVYVFRLTVTGGSTATVQVTVNPTAPLVANAGTPQTITLPTNQVTLNGSASTGNITAYLWTKITGPDPGSIQSPTSAITVVTGLVAGVYTFQLRVTDDLGAFATGTVNVTVNSNTGYASPVASIVAPTQTISLPASSVNETVSFVLTGASLNSINWSKFKTPGQTPKTVVFLGSSTTAGSGASTEDSAYVWRFTNFYTAQGMISRVVNLGTSGINLYNAMPTGYVAPSSVVNVLGAAGAAVDPTINVTKALSYSPDMIVISFPTNGYDVLSTADIMNGLQTLYNAAAANGAECFVTTTQPREDFTASRQAFLQVLRDSILLRFGPHAMNFYDAVTVPGTTRRLYPADDDDDDIHLNDRGHRQLFNIVVGTNIFRNKISSPSVISSPGSASTAITGLTVGTHLFQATVIDSHGQDANAIATVTVNQGANPVANAGSPQTIYLPTSQVTLDGSASSGNITSYAWTQVSGPAMDTLVSPSAVATIVRGLVQGIYVFQLMVTDNLGATSIATTTVTVNNAITGKMINVNVYGGTNPYSNSQWNNWNVNNGINSPTLTYSDGTSSGVTASLSINESVVDNGANYGGTMAPAPVLRYASYCEITRTLTLNGLKTAASYTIELYASRNSNSGQKSVFAIAGQVSDTVLTYRNLTDKAVFSGVQANSSGRIVITISTPTGYNYLNGFAITETSSNGTNGGMGSEVPSAHAASFGGRDSNRDASGSGEFLIYPNPAGDQATLYLNNVHTGALRITILDRAGVILRKTELRKEGISSSIEVPVSGLAAGIYLIVVQVNNWRDSRALIKL
ncbi:MAG: T9SS type A sorting domain-containing protein [Bacteroidota bacterium]|nr:T9SS type A sorting domain-containing protein [Bacteroidota bacterium]